MTVKRNVHSAVNDWIRRVCWFWLFAASMAAANEFSSIEEGTVRRIDIETTRVRESVVRRELTFGEGDRLSDDDIQKSRRNLHRLNLFKTLSIESVADPDTGEIDVSISGEDGWFMLPWPMAGSRGGTRYAMLALMELNYFRRAEGMALMGMIRDDELSGLFAFSVPDYSVMIGSFAASLREYAYRDGGFNVKDFENATDGEDAGDFGEIVNSYERETRHDNIQVVFPAGPDWRLVLGGSLVEISYDDAVQPELVEDEKSRILSVSLQYGKGDDTSPGPAMIGMFGRIFGLGMAAVEDELQPTRQTETHWGGRMSLDYAPEWLGSDREYVKLGGRLDRRTIFRDRSRLSLFTHCTWTSAAPDGQLPSTNRGHGLRGVYAREYRGDTLVSAGISYQRPFWTTRIGSLSANIFSEYAAAWFDGGYGAKEGVGLSLAYRFWRFPLPLGMGYTYSLDDRNGQYSFAMGGMF